MKTTICPNCYWFFRETDGTERCDCYEKYLEGHTITECRRFREASE